MMLLQRLSKVPQACPFLRLRPRALLPLMASIQTHSWSFVSPYTEGKCAGWSAYQPTTRAPTKQLVFYFWFPGKAEQRVVGFPSSGWLVSSESIFRSVCLEGAVLAMTWRTCPKQALFKSIAAVPKQSIYRVIICHLLEYVCSSSLPVFFGALSNWTGSESAISGLAAMTV